MEGDGTEPRIKSVVFGMEVLLKDVNKKLIIIALGVYFYLLSTV